MKPQFDGFECTFTYLSPRPTRGCKRYIVPGPGAVGIWAREGESMHANLFCALA